MYNTGSRRRSGRLPRRQMRPWPFCLLLLVTARDYSAQGGIKDWPSGRTACPPAGRQQIARRLSVPITEMEKSVSTGTTIQSPGIAVASVSSIQTLAFPERMTKTSSAVRRCGRAGVPGLISTSHTLVLFEPFRGVASDVKLAPESSCVGKAGLVITGMQSSNKSMLLMQQKWPIADVKEV